MNKCPVSGCGLFHERMMNCKVVRNQLAAGTLAEPWLSANRLEKIIERKICPEPVVRTVPKAEGLVPATQGAQSVHAQGPQDGQRAGAKPTSSAPCPVCEARRLKNLESVKKYRLRKTESS